MNARDRSDLGRAWTGPEAASGLGPLPGASTPATVLVVDDEMRSRDAIRRTLDEDFAVLTAGGADEARQLLERHPVTVVLCDQRMPGTPGIEFLKEVRRRWPEVVRVVISGYTDSEDLIAGINDAGIFRYVLKPWVPDHLLATVRQAVDARPAAVRAAAPGRREAAPDAAVDVELPTVPAALAALAPLAERAVPRAARARPAFGFDRIERMPGSPLDAVCATAARAARYDLSVLILGESGTGKELVARAIHAASPRSHAPFVVENCAAITDTLLESELFGHKRGSFTGAFDDHPGLFQRAHGGTLFLDEIGETSPAFQVKLLRVLQEGEVRPVGASRPVAVDVRVLAATHRDLEREVREGRFREDLYYRIAGLTLAMPPLRERLGDIAAVAHRLCAEVGAELGRPAARLGNDAIAALMAYPWPGNIRELRNEIGRAVALSDDDRIGPEAFSPKVLHGQAGVFARAAGGAAAAAASALPPGGTLQERLDAIEAMVLREVLLRHRWNKTQAAQELGLSRVGLRAKLQRFGLEARAADRPGARAADTDDAATADPA